VSDQYLWDKSGDVDPEIEELERALAPLRHAPQPLDLDRVPIEPPSWRFRPAFVGLAAALLVGLGIFFYTRRGPDMPPPLAQGSWDVERLEGAPRVGRQALAANGRLSVGQALETDATSRARVNVSDIGMVDVEPNTRVRLVGTSPTEHRLALDRGLISAVVSAPPRLFLVETPAALAVDLGCAYTLEVDDDGGGLLRVTYGFVSLERGDRHSYVPAGAVCRMRPAGPGTPYFADAPAALQAALDTFDFGGQAARALAAVLADARPQDSLTLWHLLARARPDDRAAVYERLAAILPPPAGVTFAGVQRSDAAMLETWREALEPRWWVDGESTKNTKGGR
jgi:hypothetical protein